MALDFHRLANPWFSKENQATDGVKVLSRDCLGITRRPQETSCLRVGEVAEIIKGVAVVPVTPEPQDDFVCIS